MTAQAPDQGYRFTIDLPVRTEWDSVDLIRGSIQTCFTAVFSDVEGCERLAMVTGELLENAVKYGAWKTNADGHPACFRLYVSGLGGNASIRVENPVHPNDPGLDALFETLAWIASFDDTADMYRARLLEFAGGAGTGPSRLGLIRVVHEGGCRLRAQVENETLAVIADFDL